MNRFYKLLLLLLITIVGCKSREIENNTIDQSINSLNMNIFSNEGKKMLSVESPYSNYDNKKNIFYLKETTINLFNNNKGEYIITREIKIIQ